MVDNKMFVEGPGHIELLTLPPELLLRIYEELPSFVDASSLSSTCRTLHNVWQAHRTAITNGIVNNLECYPYPSKLLAALRQRPPLDQGDRSVRDLSDLLRHARHIETIVQYIAQRYIPKLTFHGIPKSKKSTIYEGNAVHPPKLTRTERLRVFRACYQIMLLGCARDKRTYLCETMISAMPLRQFFCLDELLLFARQRGRLLNSWQQAFEISNLVYDVMKSRYKSQIAKLRNLRICQGEWNFYVIWDHSQDNLKSIIYRRSVGDLRRDGRAAETASWWSYEPGDELFVVDDDASLGTT